MRVPSCLACEVKARRLCHEAHSLSRSSCCADRCSGSLPESPFADGNCLADFHSLVGGAGCRNARVGQRCYAIQFGGYPRWTCHRRECPGVLVCVLVAQRLRNLPSYPVSPAVNFLALSMKTGRPLRTISSNRSVIHSRELISMQRGEKSCGASTNCRIPP